MAFLSGWNRRIKLIVSAGYIDSDLTNFPFLVKLDSSHANSVRNEIGINTKKIAITQSDEVSQCYLEIQQFSSVADSNILLWTKGPAISASQNTDFYLYYDNDQSDNDTYVGNIGASAAQQVWDSNFICVYHFEEKTGSFKDSTSNVHNGTTVNLSETERTNTSPIGNAYDFNGSEYINLPEHADFKPDYVTIEAFCKTDSGNANWSRIFDRYHYPATGYCLIISNAGKGMIDTWTTGTNQHYAATTATIEGDTNWHSLAGSYGDNHTKIFDNGNLDQDTTGGSGQVLLHETGQTPRIGDGVYDPNWKGQITELRLSKIDRSDAWKKASSYSNWNTLLTYGPEETHGLPTSAYSISGCITQFDSPVTRRVRLYLRSDGELVNEIDSISASGGQYSFEIIANKEDYHFIMVLDECADIYTFNALIQDRIIPTCTVSGGP